MGYGIQVFGSNGQTLFDSDEGGTFLDMSGSSTGSYTNQMSLNYSAGDIVLARPTISGTVNYLSVSDVNNSQIVFFGTGTYILLKPTTSFSDSVPAAGDYGLIIYDGNGVAQANILFSTSRTDTKAVNIETMYDAGTRSGQISDSASLISSSHTGLYVSVHGGVNSGATPVSFARQSFIFYNGHSSYGSNIRFNSYISGGFPLNGSIFFTNEQSIMVASIRG